ncbi:MAG: aminotransferase class V-fold PLP-dependent enzyme [Candidatus Aminicenantes bacterium]|nr:aminotransferase class V-fold PLP-dependent enzyme [Candidatus Aminicenantes bacterium]
MQTIREQFPGLKDKVFLDAACVSLAPQDAVDAVRRFLTIAAECPARSSTQHHILMDEMRGEARKEAARLIGAAEEEIAIVESTTYGLTVAADAIPLSEGDEVLICDLEYLQVAVPWAQKLGSEGVRLAVVPNSGGVVTPDHIAARLTAKTRVLAMSSVQWSNGFRADLAAISSLCRERNIWLVVDAVQHLGAMPLDVRATPVDFLACGGHKWLNSPFGAGLLYIRKSRLPDLKKLTAGYLSLETPEGGWETYFQTPSISPLREYAFVDEARRYETGGTANYPGAVGLAASLKLINGLGRENIAAHILELTDFLIEGLAALGVEVVTPVEKPHRSGIVTFSLGPVERNLAVTDHLLDRRILVSVRYTSGIGGVRVSCHFFNSKDDLTRLLNEVKDFLKKNL